MTFTQKIIDSYQKFPEQTAFVIKEIPYSYVELFDIIYLIAEHFETIKKNKISKVGIIANDDLETYAAIIASLLTGKTYIPLNPKNPIDRNIYALETSEVDLLLYSEIHPSLSEQVISRDIPLYHVNKSNKAKQKTAFAPTKINNADLAYILFTSGSTGFPKGVPITYENIEAFIESFLDFNFSLSQKDKFLQMFDLTFDLSVMSFLIPLTIGASVYTIPENEIKYMYAYKLLEKYELTFALMVPSIINQLKDYLDEIELPSLKYSLFCGEALNTAITQRWNKCLPNGEVWNVYGPTEATIFCTYYNVPKSPDKIKQHNAVISIGKPMKNVSTIIVNEQNEQIKEAGKSGELCIAGRQLTNGYLKDSDKNKIAFFEYNSTRFYKTGDICCYTTEDELVYIGRKDSQVKIQGYRVELGEIEYHIRKLLDMEEVLAITRKDESGNHLIYVFIENYSGDLVKLKEQLKHVLPVYMQPHNIFSIPHFPLNVNGKKDKNVLTQEYLML